MEVLGEVGGVGTCVGTPEGQCVGGRVPVLAADSLEEDREVDACPLQRQRGAVVVARLAVADDFAVARIVDGVLADGDYVVVVQIAEFQVAGAQSLFGSCRGVDDLVHGRLVDGVVAGFLVRGEQSVDAVTPDFAPAHAFVVFLGEGAVGVVELGDVRNVVVEGQRHAVRERTAQQLELVAPVERELVAFGAQVGAVHFRRVGAVGGRQGDARGEHVLRVADVEVGGEGQAVVQETHVHAEVLVDASLPREVGSHRGRDGRRGGLVAAEQVVLTPDRDFADIVVITDVLVAQLAVREAQFEVVELVADAVEEGLFRDAPSQRERGEEAPALPALEARCAVVAAARLDEVFALVVVVQTAEEAHQGVFVLTAAYLHAFFAVGALAHEVQVVERFGEQVVTRCGHVLEEFGLPVEADHRLEVVVPGEGAFERAVEVGLIVGVGHALFIEFVLHLSGRERVYFTRILRVLGVDLTVGVARGIEHVGEVTLDLQPFDRGPGQLRRGRHVVRMVVVGVAVFVEDRGQSVHDLVVRERRVVDARAVGVDGNERSQSVYGAPREGRIDIARAGVEVLVVVVAGVVAHLQPLVDVEGDFRPECDLLELVGMLAKKSLLAVIAAREQIVHTVVASRERDAVARVRVLILEQVVIPVGVAVVDIGVAAVALVDLDPRAVGMLRAVVAAGPQLHHVLFGVARVIVSGV